MTSTFPAGFVWAEAARRCDTQQRTPKRSAQLLGEVARRNAFYATASI